MKFRLFSILLFVFLVQNQGPCFSSPYTEAQSAFSKNENQKVIDLLASNIDKLDLESLLLLGKAYGNLNNSYSALKVYTAILSKKADHLEAKSLAGYEQAKMGIEKGKDGVQNTKEGIALLKEVIETNSKYELAYTCLSKLYEKRKNKYELRLLYQDMIEKLGEKKEYVTELCELTTSSGLYDDSLKYCRRGIQINSHEPKNYIFLAFTLKAKEEPINAEKYLKTAASSFEKSSFAQYTYAQYLEEKKNYIGAFNYYNRALKADPKDFKSIIGLGLTGVEIHKFKEALEVFEKACKINRDVTTAFRKATNIIRLQKKDDWLKKFETSLDKCI